MKNRTFIYILFALIALVAFSSFSTSRITSEVLPKREIETDAASKHETLSEREVCEMLNKVKIIEVYTAKPKYEPEPEIWVPDERDIQYIAKVIWNEARGCSRTEQAAVAWCILNRVDDPCFPDNVRDVVTAPYQFAYSDETPAMALQCAIAEDVLRRWHDEKTGEKNVGRVLPQEFCFFWGDNEHNYFRTSHTAQTYYDWNLESPYEE